MKGVVEIFLFNKVLFILFYLPIFVGLFKDKKGLLLQIPFLLLLCPASLSSSQKSITPLLSLDSHHHQPATSFSLTLLSTIITISLSRLLFQATISIAPVLLDRQPATASAQLRQASPETSLFFIGWLLKFAAASWIVVVASASRVSLLLLLL